MATRRINNFDRDLLDLGSVTFLVPNVVFYELIHLEKIPHKQNDIKKTLEFIKKFKRISINGIYADKEILNFVKSKKSFVGTMDKELKKKIKVLGSSIISFHNNNFVLEN